MAIQLIYNCPIIISAARDVGVMSGLDDIGY